MAFAMVFVLLSSIAETFDVTLRAVGWVVIVEALIISALLLPMGGVADAFGRRRVLILGLSVFGVGAVATGLAPTFALLIVARVVMAVGNALVQSVATGMLVAIFPPEERGRALGAQTTAVSVGAASGPLLAGVALEVLPWQALFLLLPIPVGLSIVAALLVLPDDRPTAVGDGRGFDPVGGLLSGLSIVLLVFTISNPFGFDWLSVPTLGGAVVVIVLLAMFTRWELARAVPLLELRLFVIGVFRNAVLVRLFGFIGGAATNLLLPIYLISVRDLSAVAASVIVFFQALGMGVSAQIAGRLYDWVGPRIPTVLGLALQIGSALALASAGSTTSMVTVTVIVFCAGLSVSMWNVPNNSAMMGAVPVENLGVGGAFTNVTRTLGTVLGQAVAAGIVATVMASRQFDIPLGDIATTPGAAGAFIEGWRTAYLAIAGLTVLLLGFAVRLPGRPRPPKPGESRPSTMAA